MREQERVGRTRGGLFIFAVAMAAWLLLGLADVFWNVLTAVYKESLKPRPISELLLINLPIWVAAGLLTPAVVWLSRRVPFRRGDLRRAIWVHLGGLVAFVLLHATMVRSFSLAHVGKPITFESLVWNVRDYLAWGLDREVLLFVVIVGLVQAVDYYGRYRERERVAAALEVERARLQTSLSDARLETLRMQLQPHFLFNTLNAISTLILRGDGAAAQEMLQQLSRFLRMTLDESNTQEVSLQTELEFLDAYIRIQKVRFGERLRVELEVAADARAAIVPCLILQPLVENSIRHGLGADPRDALIQIRASCADHRLHLTVEDNGRGLPATAAQVEGTGLRNIRERLTQLYPGGYRFELGPRPAGGTIARIEIPFACDRARAGTAARHREGAEPGHGE